jgi:hypothetical protein
VELANVDRQPNSIASAVTDASPSGMTIDLEAIAQRQRCELSALRVALPLLEQGYEPPFLTRYRRDEIGNISERALWELVSALRTEKQLETRRDELRAKYQEGQLEDQALLDSIADAATPRQLDRISRRIRTESGHSPPASRLAVRLLNPQAGDPADLQTLSVMVVGEEHAAVAIDGLEKVLGQYLAADSRIRPCSSDPSATSWAGTSTIGIASEKRLSLDICSSVAFTPPVETSRTPRTVLSLIRGTSGSPLPTSRPTAPP